MGTIGDAGGHRTADREAADLRMSRQNGNMSAAGPDAGSEFSLVRGDLLFRLQRRIGLIPGRGARRRPARGLLRARGVAAGRRVGARRWQGVAGEDGRTVVRALRPPRALPDRDPALHPDRGHSRTRSGPPTGPQLPRVRPCRRYDRPRLRQILEGVGRLRDGVLPWVFVAGVVAGLAHRRPGPPRGACAHLATDERGQGTPFGAWWFLYISRVIFVALLLAWLWRIALWTIALARISRLDLALVPTHADRVFADWASSSRRLRRLCRSCSGCRCCSPPPGRTTSCITASIFAPWQSRSRCSSAWSCSSCSRRSSRSRRC